MKEVLQQTGTATRQENARWYLGTTLTERISLLAEEATSTPTQAGTEQATLRFRKWKSQSPFQRSEQSFIQRLELDGLDEEKLLELLARPAEEIRAASGTSPAWLVELLTAFEQPDPAILACLPLEHIGDAATDAAFQALKPLLARGFARLLAGITELQKRYTRLPFDSLNAAFLLLPRFLENILNKPSRTLVLELNVARVQGRLQGEMPEERFLYFLRQLARPENMLTLLEEYPVLARQLVEMTERWVNRGLELLQRLCADWDEIREKFFPTGDPGLLSEIREGAGDAHHGERSVTMLTWSSGLRLVYKPRPLAIDAHFQELLHWLNAHGCQPAFRVFKLLDKGQYGWYEFVSTSGCESRAEIERFYQRMGGYLALLYVLEATDFHAENLLAAGEDPMLVDLESLFQPHAEKYEAADRYGYELLTHSVRRVGLLPQRQWLGEQAGGADLSGLGGPANQQTTSAANAWTGQGTDEMRVTRENVEVKLGNHRPTLHGEEIDTLTYEQSIVEGFTTVYRLLLRRREEFLNTLLPPFANDEVRVLLRPTQQYARLLSDSLHPDVLRDGLDRDWLFDRLWISVEQKPYLARVIAAERSDLQGCDIPKFTTSPNSRDLFTASGECITNFFPSSGLELVRAGIQRLGEQDLERQTWIIRASFACMEMNNTQVKPKHGLQLHPTTSQATRAQLIAEAEAIADRLCQLELPGEDMAGWLVINLVAGQEWRPVPAGPDLYNGLPGIAMFLAYLGQLSGEERYTELARRTVKTLQALFVPKVRLWQWGNAGAFDGLGSLVYLFSHLGTLWNDPTLYQEARETIALIPNLLATDGPFDMLSGTAGAIAVLLSLYAVAPDVTTLATAVQCGEHLLDHARPMPRGIAWSAQPDQVPLAGFSHGNAGIALSLLRLASASGDERFHQAALAAMEYERGIFSAEKQNWPDLREATNASDPQTYQYMTAWCHGAAGVGMARLASLQYHDDATIRAEIDAAVQTTLKEGFGRNHSLCHGDMGNIEVLLLATHLLPEHYAREQVTTLQAMLLESIKAQGWQSGIPRIVETPGLMLGLAGTGYALLRMADPQHVPALLVLAPPHA